MSAEIKFDVLFTAKNMESAQSLLTAICREAKEHDAEATVSCDEMYALPYYEEMLGMKVSHAERS